MHEVDLEPLRTTDRNGTKHEFWCWIELAMGRWAVRVFETPDIWDEHYSASFTEFGDELLQSVSLNNFRQTWTLRKGISEAVFQMVYERSERPIVSSRTWREGEGEWRTDRATRMWKRFVNDGLAAALHGTDRFVYPAQAREAALSALRELGE